MRKRNPRKQKLAFGPPPPPGLAREMLRRAGIEDAEYIGKGRSSRGPVLVYETSRGTIGVGRIRGEETVQLIRYTGGAAKKNPRERVRGWPEALGTNEGADAYAKEWAGTHDVQLTKIGYAQRKVPTEDPRGVVHAYRYPAWNESTEVLIVWKRGDRYRSLAYRETYFKQTYALLPDLQQLAMSAHQNPTWDDALGTNAGADEYVRWFENEYGVKAKKIGIWRELEPTRTGPNYVHVYQTDSEHVANLLIVWLQEQMRQVPGEIGRRRAYDSRWLTERQLKKWWEPLHELEQLTFGVHKNPYRSAVIAMPSAAQMAYLNGEESKPYDPREEQFHSVARGMFYGWAGGPARARRLSQAKARELVGRAIASATVVGRKEAAPKPAKGKKGLKVAKQTWLKPAGAQVPTKRGIEASKQRYAGTYVSTRKSPRTGSYERDTTDLILGRQAYEEMLAMARKRGHFYRVVREQTRQGKRYFVWPMPPSCRVPGPGRANYDEAAAIAGDLNRRADPYKTGQWWQPPTLPYGRGELAHWLPPAYVFTMSYDPAEVPKKRASRKRRTA